MPYEAIGVYRSLCAREGMAPTIFLLTERGAFHA